MTDSVTSNSLIVFLQRRVDILLILLGYLEVRHGFIDPDVGQSLPDYRDVPKGPEVGTREEECVHNTRKYRDEVAEIG